MRDDLKIGDRYNWIGQKERLIYIGPCHPRNGNWLQFALVEEPDVVWCKVQPRDMHMLERTL